MSEWKDGILSDIAEVVMGQSPSGDTCNETGIGTPLLNGPTEFGGHHPHPVQFTTNPRKLANEYDLLFCVRGSTTGRMNWSDQKYAIGRGIAAIRSKHGPKCRHFVRALIDTGLTRLLALATGSTFPNLSREQIRDMECVIPPLPEQQRIAYILGLLDDKIELNRKMNETLEEMARAIFKSWFVDFDPVVAKSEGRQPDGMDAKSAKLFPDSFEDFGTRADTEGVEGGGFGDVASSRRSIIGVGEFLPDTAYIGLEHMPRRSIALSEWGDASSVESAKSQFCRGDVLFGKLRPYFHKVGIAPVDGICSTDILVLVPRKAEWSAFVLGHASSDELVDFADGCSTGTRMPRVSWGDLSRYSIPIPPYELAGLFTQLVTPFIDAIVANTHESRALVSTRDSLLPRLLSGELVLPVRRLA